MVKWFYVELIKNPLTLNHILITMELTITKRDGTREPFNADMINRSIERACQGMEDPVGMVTQIATETRLTLYDGITTEEMDQATINAAVQNIK